MVIASLLLENAVDCRFWPSWNPAYQVTFTMSASNGFNFTSIRNARLASPDADWASGVLTPENASAHILILDSKINRVPEI